MKTNIYSALLGTSALVLSLLSFRPAAFAQVPPVPTPQYPYEGDQPVYAVPSVVYEAPVVYQAPVTYQMPVLYMGPVTYAMAPIDPQVACAPPVREPTPSTVVVIGGQGGSYSYTTDTICTPNVVYIGGASSPSHYTFRGR